MPRTNCGRVDPAWQELMATLDYHKTKTETTNYQIADAVKVDYGTWMKKLKRPGSRIGLNEFARLAKYLKFSDDEILRIFKEAMKI